MAVFQCRQCGLVQLNSKEHATIHDYSMSKMHDSYPISLTDWRTDCTVDDQRRYNMFRGIIKGKKLLELGSGCCGFLELCSAVATKTVGIEPEKRVLTEYSKNTNYDLFGSLEDIDEHDKFDIIVMFHVIEHLEDPIKYLKNLVRFLNPNGRIIVECPNVNDALLNLFHVKAFSEAYFWSQHLYYFSRNDIKRLTQQAGLSISREILCQRYGYENHLHWILSGRGGGHKEWKYLRIPFLESVYALLLSLIGQNDTILVELTRS